MDILNDLAKRMQDEYDKPRYMPNINSEINHVYYDEGITIVDVEFKENFFQQYEWLYFHPLGHGSLIINVLVMSIRSVRDVYSYRCRFETTQNIEFHGYFCNRLRDTVTIPIKEKYEPYKTPDGKDVVEGMDWCQVSF